MKTGEIEFKYFAVRGETAANAIASGGAELNAANERRKACLEKYGADCLWGGSRSAPHALGWKFERESFRDRPPMKENFLKPECEYSGGTLYALYKPDQRYKAGKAIKADLKAVGPFKYSDYITKLLGVDRTVFGELDGRMVMCGTSAGQYGDTLILRVPVGGDHGEDFTVPPDFHELKKSEFIAITEEAQQP